METWAGRFGPLGCQAGVAKGSGAPDSVSVPAQGSWAAAAFLSSEAIKSSTSGPQRDLGGLRIQRKTEITLGRPDLCEGRDRKGTPRLSPGPGRDRAEDQDVRCPQSPGQRDGLPQPWFEAVCCFKTLCFPTMSPKNP